jgi:hypothetical protein
MHSEMYVGLQVKCPLLLLILAEIEIYWKILVKRPSVRFHENPFSGSRVITCRQTDITKLIGAYFQLFVPNAKRIFIRRHKNNHS